MKVTDGELLRRYARQRSEAAFEELVQRRINLVYSAALRQVNNDAHLAEDVTQAVFTDLARKAAALARHPSLNGWLYTSTRYLAAKLARTEQRRSLREAEAHAMNTIDSTSEPEADWAQIRPLLDEAMHTLSDPEREVVLLRHFEQLSYAEIGLRFGLAEDTARMRVNRALTKLHENLSKRGVTSTALALAGLLSRNAVSAAPAHLAAKMARVARMGMRTTHGLASFLTSKLALAVATVALIAGMTTARVFWHGGAPVPTVAEKDAVSPKEDAKAPTNVAAISKPASPYASGALLHLQMVTTDTGKPIPDVSVECIDWSGPYGLRRKQLKSNRLGVCEVNFERDTPRLNLTAEKAPFADAQVLWQRGMRDTIPTNYVLHMERAVPIGGTVTDADGNPVAGATVAWTLNVPDPSYVPPPRSNEFYGNKYEAITDQQGNWQLVRVAEAVIPYLFGGAKESNHLDSSEVFTFRDASAQQQLRQGSYVFKLGRALTAIGIVVDESGAPVPGANVGMSSISGLRSGISLDDGGFSIGGCGPGKQRVSATAPGFALLMGEADLQENGGPVRLVLHAGKLLALQFVDPQGNPIPQVLVHVAGREEQHRAGWISVPTPDFQTTDQEGRVTWSNAPDADVRLRVFDYARVGGTPNESEDNVGTMAMDGSGPAIRDLEGMRVRPEGEEQVVVLERDVPKVRNTILPDRDDKYK